MNETELWRYREEDIALCHVFSTVAVEDTVLVFCEARHGNGGDSDCRHDLVMRHSTDGGITFSESRCLSAGYCPCNPCPVYDPIRQRLFLFFAENIGNTETRTYYTFSDDLGKSWGTHTEITHMFEPPFSLPGPGHGICLSSGAHAGRLILPIWHRTKGVDAPEAERGYCVSLLYSDDRGESWHHGPYIGHEFCANESRISETAQGLVWSIRTKDLQPALLHSTDGAESWGAPMRTALSPAVNCDIGAISLRQTGVFEDLLLLSRPSTISNRRDMEICISYDGGTSFPETFALTGGDVFPGYSDLCIIGKVPEAVGLVHCRNNRVLFTRIPLQALTGNNNG